MADKYDQLEKIKKLHDEGTLTDEEFVYEKSKIMGMAVGSPPPPSPPPPPPPPPPSSPYTSPASAPAEGLPRPWGMELNSFCMLMHLSQFAGFALPLAGLVLPIVMWATCKDEAVEVDIHGRIILNWMISSLIYVAIAFVLIFVVVGIFALIALVIAGFIFTIIGAVKASGGVAWKYPLSIPFLRVDEPGNF